MFKSFSVSTLTLYGDEHQYHSVQIYRSLWNTYFYKFLHFVSETRLRCFCKYFKTPEAIALGKFGTISPVTLMWLAVNSISVSVDRDLTASIRFSEVHIVYLV